MYFNYWNPNPFIHLKSGKGTLFAIRVKLPRKSHYRGYPPGFTFAPLAMSETISLPEAISMLQSWLFSCVECLGLYTMYEVGGLYCFLFFFLDLDECKDKTHQCDVNANCTNIPGSYNCTCRPGYSGNGSICNSIINYTNLHLQEVVMFSL